MFCILPQRTGMQTRRLMRGGVARAGAVGVRFLTCTSGRSPGPWGRQQPGPHAGPKVGFRGATPEAEVDDTPEYRLQGVT